MHDLISPSYIKLTHHTSLVLVLNSLISSVASFGIQPELLSSHSKQCRQNFEELGLNPIKPFEAFSGYYLLNRRAIDYRFHGSEMICYLNGTHLLCIKNKGYSSGHIPWEKARRSIFLRFIVDFLTFVKGSFHLLTLPPIIFRTTSSDVGIPSKPSAHVCLHATGLDFTLCQGTIVLPVHFNQLVGRMSVYVKDAAKIGSWKQKREVACWRGNNNPPHPSSLRNRLVRIAEKVSFIDAAFGEYSWSNLTSCKVIIAVDGYGYFSHVIKRALLSGSVVARVAHESGNGE
eukprot:360406-Pelagomonas_calceolata.AAC.1